jgi:urease accessory protein
MEVIEQEAVARDDPARLVPVPLPRELAAFEPALPTAGSARHGKVGLMELAFERQGKRTRMVHHYYRSPLQMFQPMYYDPHRPDLPIIVVLQNGGGMLQGDRYRIDIECGRDAAAHITTQSAGKLYKCDENFIVQVIELVAHENSLIEFLPDMTIPYRDSRFFQYVKVRVDPSATVILGDVLAPGRTAYGEHHDYQIFHSLLEAFDPDGNLLVSDRIALQPGRFATTSPAILGEFDALGVLYVFSRQHPLSQLATAVRDALEDDPHTLSGVSELPNGAGISVRILGSSAHFVERARTTAWNAARLELLGVPAPNLRKA